MPKALKQDIEALKAQALENAPQALTLIDLQGKRLWANKAFCQLLGKPLEALLGVSVELVYPLEEQERVKRALTQETLQSGGISNFETWFKKNGERVHVQIHTSLIRDKRGDPSAILYSAADISAQKNRLEVLLNGLAEGVCVADSSGGIHYANPCYATLVDKPKEALLQGGWHGLYPQEERAKVARELAKLEDEEGSDEDVVSGGVYLLPDGQRRVTKRTLRPIVWEGKRRVLVTLSDITEIKRAQETAERLQAFYEAMTELSADGIATTSPDGRIRTANRALRDLLGLPDRELGSVFDWINPEQHQEHRQWIENILQKGHGTCLGHDTTVHAKNGRVFNVVLNHGLSRFPDDNTPCVIFYVKDVTELKAAKEKAELLLKLSPLGICEWRPGGDLLDLNEQYAAMVGHTKEEVFKMGWKNLTAPEYQGDPDRLHEENALKGTDKTYRKEYIHKDGHRVPIYLVTEPIFDKDRTLSHYISYVQDLTPFVEYERKLEGLIEEQKRMIEVTQEQKRTILELSTPILPVWGGILLAPLIGNFDSMRMQRLHENLLQATAEQKPKAVLLDLSGLVYVDTQVISEIVHLIDALRLLGTITLLVGIQPRVAQGLVRLGIDLKGAPSHATLAQGLKAVLGSAR
ncbi:MAG: PAS domain S-box protein [Nitrospirota bacterium]|nr:PAS domain S-box protein [Nitrospirota bacterium]